MPLVFASAMVGVIVVPGGFVTDFASVPRFLLTYLLTGNTAHAPATVHDYFYRTPSLRVTRKQADDVFDEAMSAMYPADDGDKPIDVPWWRQQLMYAGVRLGGSRAFRKRT